MQMAEVAFCLRNAMDVMLHWSLAASCALTTKRCVAVIAAVVEDMDDDQTAAAAEPDDDDFEAQARAAQFQFVAIQFLRMPV